MGKFTIFLVITLFVLIVVVKLPTLKGEHIVKKEKDSPVTDTMRFTLAHVCVRSAGRIRLMSYPTTFCSMCNFKNSIDLFIDEKSYDKLEGLLKSLQEEKGSLPILDCQGISVNSEKGKIST